MIDAAMVQAGAAIVSLILLSGMLWIALRWGN